VLGQLGRRAAPGQLVVRPRERAEPTREPLVVEDPGCPAPPGQPAGHLGMEQRPPVRVRSPLRLGLLGRFDDFLDRGRDGVAGEHEGLVSEGHGVDGSGDWCYGGRMENVINPWSIASGLSYEQALVLRRGWSACASYTGYPSIHAPVLGREGFNKACGELHDLGLVLHRDDPAPTNVGQQVLVVLGKPT